MSLEFLITTLKDLLSSWPCFWLILAVVFQRNLRGILEAFRERVESITQVRAGSFTVTFGGEVDSIPKVPGTPEDIEIEDAIVIPDIPTQEEKKNE